MRGSGGTQGGLSMFAVGFGLAALAVYLLLDSVHLQSGGGWISGMMRGGTGGGGGRGWWETTSMGIIFVPFLIGVIVLFYDASLRWAWWLTYIGLGVVIVEIVSRIRFVFDIKTTHFLLMLLLFAAGAGLMLRSYRDQSKGSGQTSQQPPREEQG